MSHLVRPVQVTVRQEGTHVLVIREGRFVFEMPWDAALALANAIYVQARRAEELAKAAEIASDQAILLRLGVPLGLSGRADIQQEAQKAAAWDSGLRRAIPLRRAKGVGGVRSAEGMGAPRVIRHKPGGGR